LLNSLEALQRFSGVPMTIKRSLAISCMSGSGLGSNGDMRDARNFKGPGQIGPVKAEADNNQMVLGDRVVKVPDRRSPQFYS